MAIESATYIDDLVTANPATETSSGDGDDHIRLIKTVLQNTFPNISGAMTASHTELNYVDIGTLGTAAASKALVADASANINAAAITWTNLGTVTTVDLNGGTVDGVTINSSAIGGTTPAAGAFTTLSASGASTLTGNVSFGGTAGFSAGTTVNEFSIDGTLAGDSDDAVPTEKAVKTYVDAQVGGVGSTDTNWVVVSGSMYLDEFDSGLLSLPIPVTGTVTRVDTAWRFNSATALTVTITTSASGSVASLSTTGTQGIDSETSPGNSSVSAGAFFIASCGTTGSGDHGHVTITLLIEVS